MARIKFNEDGMAEFERNVQAALQEGFEAVASRSTDLTDDELLAELRAEMQRRGFSDFVAGSDTVGNVRAMQR